MQLKGGVQARWSRFLGLNDLDQHLADAPLIKIEVNLKIYRGQDRFITMLAGNAEKPQRQRAARHEHQFLLCQGTAATARGTSCSFGR